MNKLEVKAEAENTFLEVVNKFAVATREEEGNISFDLFKIEGKTQHYAVFERYTSKDLFDAHLATGYAAECFGALPDLLTHPMTDNLIVVSKID